MHNEMIIAFSIYFGMLISLGVYFYYKNKSNDEFALAGRKLNYWVTAFSAQASDMSDWLFMAFPGLIYVGGFSEIWIGIGLIIFMFLSWHFIAPKLREQTEHENVMTLSSFFAKRYNDTSGWIQRISGLACLYFFTFYIAAGLVGLGRVFESAFHIDYQIGIIVGLAITLLYTSLGGLLAIAWSDLFQGTFLLAVLIFVPVYTMVDLGGIQAAYDLLLLQPASYTSCIPQSSFIATVFAIASWGIGYFGQPHILINFMSIDDVKKIKYAKYVGSSWQIIAILSAVFVGIIGKLYLPNLSNQELIFIDMVNQLFPPLAAGFILCAILAATISTINTQSLVTSTLVTNDLLPQSLRTKKHMLFFSRLAICIVPCISLVFALNPSAYVLDLVLYAWSGLGTTFGPLLLTTLYTKVTKQAAYAGLIAGIIIGCTWSASYTQVPTLVAGFAGSFIAIWTTNWCTK